MLRKTNRVSLVEEVVSQLENLIESNHWIVGDKLPSEMELMKEFDVSRNTLREAIRALVHSGLLQTKQGSGTIVCSTSGLNVALHRHIEKSSLIETLEVRLALEREAAYLAAIRRSEEDIFELKKCIESCRIAAEKESFEDFIDADLLFHKKVVKAADNQMLFDLYEQMTDTLYTSIHDVIVSNPFDYSNEIHDDLVHAIIEHDTDAATMYVNKYINGFREKLTNIMED